MRCFKAAGLREDEESIVTSENARAFWRVARTINPKTNLVPHTRFGVWGL